MKNVVIILVAVVAILGTLQLMHPNSEVMVRSQNVDAQGKVVSVKEVPLSDALVQLQRNILETQYLVVTTTNYISQQIIQATHH